MPSGTAGIAPRLARSRQGLRRSPKELRARRADGTLVDEVVDEEEDVVVTPPIEPTPTA